MIDPDGIIVQTSNLPDLIKINNEIISIKENNQEIKLNVINGVYNAVNPMAFNSGFDIMNNNYFYFINKNICRSCEALYEN